MDKSPKIAAIDVGTNSFHMVIAKINKKGAMSVISREKEMVRLGSSGKDMKYLQEKAIERAIKTLYAFTKMAESHDATIRAVATSAVREAVNKEGFIKRVKADLNIDIEVVSGVEEGRLIFLGVIHALPIYDKKILVIDIGGGSTETIIGWNQELEYVHSEKIGSFRLTKLFFETDNYTKETISEAKKYAKGGWAPVLNQIKEIGFDQVIGTSGTFQSIANMALAKKNIQAPNILNGYSVTSEELLEVIHSITHCKNSEEVKKIPGADPKRADILIGGAIILETLIEELAFREVLLSPYALREGIVYDTYEKMEDSKNHGHIVDLRRETIIHLAQRYNVYNEHAMFVTKISLAIFDALSSFHNLGNNEREFLEYAAILHDIGYWISHDQHHKHSYYIITHSDLPGFTNDEADIIGTIARYHRKSHPKSKHSEYSSFNHRTKYIINVLAGILRIAEGVDRRQKQNVKDISVNFPDNQEEMNILQIDKKPIIELNLIPIKTKKAIDIEIWGAKRRTELLEEILEINIDVK